MTVYKRFNQVRKALATSYYLHIHHQGTLTDLDIEALTQHQMTTAAHAAGVEPPHSDVSRSLIRKLLRVFNATGTMPTSSGPAPVGRDKLAEAMESLAINMTTVMQAAVQGARQ